MTEIKISDLSALAARPADDDLFVIVDISEALDVDKTKKITFANAVKDYADAVADTVFAVYPAVTPSARAYNNAAISINHNTNTALTFNSERWDTDSIHSTSTNPSRLTATTAGIYHIYGHIVWGSNSTGDRKIDIRVNGSTFIASIRYAASGNNNWMSISTEYSLAATDYVELVVYQTSGGSLNVEANANYSPEFGMTYLGKAST